MRKLRLRVVNANKKGKGYKGYSQPNRRECCAIFFTPYNNILGIIFLLTGHLLCETYAVNKIKFQEIHTVEHCGITRKICYFILGRFVTKIANFSSLYSLSSIVLILHLIFTF